MAALLLVLDVLCVWTLLVGVSAESRSKYSSESGSGDVGFIFPTLTVVGFQSSEYRVREGWKSIYLCAFVYEPRNVPFESFNVTITTQDGTAKSGEDYEGVAATLGPFNQTHRHLCVKVALRNDMVCESSPYPEYFMAAMETDNENVTVGLTRTAVVIDDRFEPECVHVSVGFEHTTYVTNEEAHYIQVCVKMFSPASVARDILLRVSTHSATAMSRKDFTPILNRAVGPLGHYTTRTCFLVFILNDRDCERRAERFTLSLETNDDHVSFMYSNAIVVIDGTTEHYDCASVRAGFLYPYYIAREGDGNVLVCAAAFEPQRFGAQFTLMVRTQDKTALAGTDYVPIRELEIGTFSQGMRLKCFSVLIINDGVCGDDAGHYFILKLSTYSPLVLVSPDSTKVYIYDAVDCIRVELGFDITTISAREDKRLVELCVTVFWPSILQRSVDVLVNTHDITATAGLDYVAMTDRKVTFSQSSRHICFNTTIMLDSVCNESEVFRISLTSTQPRVFISPSNAYILIKDPAFCTAVKVGLEQSSYTTHEGAGSVQLCGVIIMDGFPMNPQFNLLVSTQDGSAKSSSDYTRLSNLLIGRFGPSISRVCFSVSILEDGVCEQDRVETFTVTVRPQSPEVEIPHARKVATVFLEDSAVCIPVVLGFEQSSYQGLESNRRVEVCVSVQEPAELKRAVTVSVHTVDGTATSGSDYGSISMTLGPFSQSVRRLCFNLNITDDRRCDKLVSEQLTLQLSSSQPNVTLATSRATVLIQDSPECTPGTIRFDQAEFISSENIGVAILCASLSQSTAQNITVVVVTRDHTAHAGTDYVTVEQELGPFGTTSRQNCIHILLISDGVCEGTMTELFDVQLVNSDDRTTVIDNAAVIIYDDSTCISASVAFESVEYSVQESSRVAEVCISVLRPSVVEREFVLFLTSTDGDAIGGVDYLPITRQLLGNFSLTQRRHCLSLVILDDDTCEEPEESFSISVLPHEFINISRPSVNVYISDSREIECDQVHVGFESTAYIVLENAGNVQACVSVSSPQILQWDFNLTLLSLNGSATGGLDFQPINTLLHFSSNRTRNCFLIFIINDKECEAFPNEKFSIVLRGSDPRLVISPSSLTITIDDSGIYIRLTDIDCYPLEIYFTGNTPAISGNTVRALLATRGRSLPQTITCDLTKNGVLIQTKNCTNKSVIFSNIRQKGVYNIKATVITARDSVSVIRKLRVTLDPTACSAHLINRGVVISGGGTAATVEFTATGPVNSFSCTLDEQNLGSCVSPLQLRNLEFDSYILRILPTGASCSRVKILKENILTNVYSG